MYNEQNAQRRSELEELVRDAETALTKTLSRISYYKDELRQMMPKISDSAFHAKIETLVGSLEAQKASGNVSLRLIGALNLPPQIRPPLPKVKPEDEKQPPKDNDDSEDEKPEEKDEQAPA